MNKPQPQTWDHGDQVNQRKMSPRFDETTTERSSHSSFQSECVAAVFEACGAFSTSVPRSILTTREKKKAKLCFPWASVAWRLDTSMKGSRDMEFIVNIVMAVLPALRDGAVGVRNALLFVLLCIILFCFDKWIIPLPRTTSKNCWYTRIKWVKMAIIYM